VARLVVVSCRTPAKSLARAGVWRPLRGQWRGWW